MSDDRTKRFEIMRAKIDPGNTQFERELLRVLIEIAETMEKIAETLSKIEEKGVEDV